MILVKYSETTFRWPVRRERSIEVSKTALTLKIDNKSYRNNNELSSVYVRFIGAYKQTRVINKRQTERKLYNVTNKAFSKQF